MDDRYKNRSDSFVSPASPVDQMEVDGQDPTNHTHSQNNMPEEYRGRAESSSSIGDFAVTGSDHSHGGPSQSKTLKQIYRNLKNIF